MQAYSKIILIPCLLTALLYLLERLTEYEITSYFALAIESFMAIIIGYRVILMNERETLMRCATLAAMIGVARFLIGLPTMVLFQSDLGSEVPSGMVGYFLVSVIGIGVYALLGLFGGKLRRTIKQSKQ